MPRYWMWKSTMNILLNVSFCVLQKKKAIWVWTDMNEVCSFKSFCTTNALDYMMLVFMLLCLYSNFILILCSPTVQVMYFGVAQGLNVTCAVCDRRTRPQVCGKDFYSWLMCCRWADSGPPYVLSYGRGLALAQL